MVFQGVGIGAIEGDHLGYFEVGTELLKRRGFALHSI